MPDTLPLQKSLASKLLSAILVDQAQPSASPEATAEIVVIAVRRIIGEAVAIYPPGDVRQAMKQALAPLLGNPLGQLLTGMEPRHVAACLEGHAEILAATLGAEVSIAVTVSTARPTPHLKVVQ